MQELDIILRIITSIGSIATSTTLIITLLSFRPKLKVVGEIPINKPNTYVISFINNKMYNIEVKSITLFKGNPRKSNSHAFHSVDLLQYNDLINPITNNIMVSKGESVEIALPFTIITNNYKVIGESLGKVLDNIFVLIKDNKGSSYCLNTHHNIDYFRKSQNEVIL